MAYRMLKTMRYFQSLGSSMMRRRSRVHAEPLEGSFVSVSATCVARAGEVEEGELDPSYQSTFAVGDSFSDDDEWDGQFSDETVNGRRYRSVALHGITHPNSLPEGIASALPGQRTNGLQMNDFYDDMDSELSSLASESTRYVEERFEASDDEDAWEDSLPASDE
eukprot:TRINITY_DN17642_c1_g5_i1.p1 TRINITY_DN17642_c1_g5~~TRINITY_DN17642_c1_g5_i1.p1  ORF type:complete len:191 (+),score=18.86 TRINITY_DN17642_c1_g5_i1:80-574(+)